MLLEGQNDGLMIWKSMQGLGAPAGSIVAGPKAFIHKVHRYRKMLGGGMRQSGIIAAPGEVHNGDPPSHYSSPRFYCC